MPSSSLDLSCGDVLVGAGRDRVFSPSAHDGATDVDRQRSDP